MDLRSSSIRRVRLCGVRCGRPIDPSRFSGFRLAWPRAEAAGSVGYGVPHARAGLAQICTVCDGSEEVNVEPTARASRGNFHGFSILPVGE